MKDFDPFNAQKESTFISSLPQIKAVAAYLTGTLSKPNVKSQDIKDLRTEFEHLLLVSHLKFHIHCTCRVRMEAREGGR